MACSARRHPGRGELETAKHRFRNGRSYAGVRPAYAEAVWDPHAPSNHHSRVHSGRPGRGSRLHHFSSYPRNAGPCGPGRDEVRAGRGTAQQLRRRVSAKSAAPGYCCAGLLRADPAGQRPLASGLAFRSLQNQTAGISRPPPSEAAAPHSSRGPRPCSPRCRQHWARPRPRRRKQSQSRSRRSRSG